MQIESSKHSNEEDEKYGLNQALILSSSKKRKRNSNPKYIDSDSPIKPIKKKRKR